MTTTNGTHVSRAEMREALNPIREDVKEIRGDVKALLLTQAAIQGAQAATKDRVGRYISFAALVFAAVASVGGFWWIPAALGLTH